MDELGYTLICGDAGEALASLPDASVHCVVSSPPYNVGMDYGEVNDALPWHEYYDMAEAVAAQLYRLLVPGGRMWWNAPPVVADQDGQRVMLADEWACIFRCAGFQQRDMVAWVSARGAGTAWGSWRSPSAPNLRGDWEAILVLYKGTWRRDGSGKDDGDGWAEMTSNVWEMAPARRTGAHPAPFPVALPSRCIRLSTWPGETVLDPFCGTGTTGVGALALERRFVGIDASPAYITAAQRALEAAPRPLPGIT